MNVVDGDDDYSLMANDDFIRSVNIIHVTLSQD